MCTSLTDLPQELVAVILCTALDEATVPSHILSVCRIFCDIGTDYLYTHLRFTSTHQLRKLALLSCSSALHPHVLVTPVSLSVDLSGKAERETLLHLSSVLATHRNLAECITKGAAHSEPDVRLKHIRLRMHSYAKDADAEADTLERGLASVSPDTFEWTGPDPDHHFSTAIVPPVASCLLKQFCSWQHIRKIVLTNISFAGIINVEGSEFPPLIGDVPSLRVLYIGKATFLNAQAVASMLCQGRMARLETMRLVDTYSESIWGRRLRRSDIEKAVQVICRPEETTAVIARVKSVIRCERRTERVTGGDRAEGTHILD